MKRNGKSALFDQLLTLLTELDNRQIAYELAHHRDEAIMVSVALTGQRWEIEFLQDGAVEIEKFVSDGQIYEATALSELFNHDADSFSSDIENELRMALPE